MEGCFMKRNYRKAVIALALAAVTVIAAKWTVERLRVEIAHRAFLEGRMTRQEARSDIGAIADSWR
jgi:hypothetical protein